MTQPTRQERERDRIALRTAVDEIIVAHGVLDAAGVPKGHGTGGEYAYPLSERIRLLTASAPSVTHWENCGLDWLDNGLNPIGCPYCASAPGEQGEPDDDFYYHNLRASPTDPGAERERKTVEVDDCLDRAVEACESTRRATIEECARIAENPYSDAVCALGNDEPSRVGRKIAAAIRALTPTTSEP